MLANLMLLLFSLEASFYIQHCRKGCPQGMPKNNSLTQAEIKQGGLCSKNGNPRYHSGHTLGNNEYPAKGPRKLEVCKIKKKRVERKRYM